MSTCRAITHSSDIIKDILKDIETVQQPVVKLTPLKVAKATTKAPAKAQSKQEPKVAPKQEPKVARVSAPQPPPKPAAQNRYLWAGEFSWIDSQNYCQQQGEILCPWSYYCPSGENKKPAYGDFEGNDVWAPIGDTYNDWVQIGNPGSNDWMCKKSQGFFTTEGEGPHWGLKNGCCMRKNELRQSPFLCCNPKEVDIQLVTKPVKPKTAAEKAVAEKCSDMKGTTMHVVFSTGCSGYQNWQAEALLYSWQEMNHPGQITRIASGCRSDADKRKVLDSAVQGDKVHFYFTPDFTSTDAGGRSFFYTNKASGMDHWFKNTEVTEDVIILLDPDMLIMKVFDFEQYPTCEGHPRGQIYGYGSRWMEWNICDEKSCTDMTRRQGENRYTVGPPYILHRNDWAKLLPEWVRFNALSLIHEPASKSNLAEMYGYSVAAASLNLIHVRSGAHMISDVHMRGVAEAWNLLEWDDQAYNATLPFEYLHYPHRFWLMKDPNAKPDERTYIDSHYRTGGWNWHKGHVPPNILTDCDIPLLKELPWAEREKWKLSDPWRAKDKKRNKPRYQWMLHQLIPRVNKGILNYKKKACGADWDGGKLIAMMQPNNGGQHRSQASYLVNVTWDETKTYPKEHWGWRSN